MAIDVDERSLEAARRNLSAYSSVEIAFRSIYEIDCDDRFDIVFSIGVIHHLSEPHRALEQLVRAARPGGKVLIWVYGYENNAWIVHVFSPLRHILFSRFPPRLVRGLSLFPAAALWLFLRLGLGRTRYFEMLRGFPFAHLRHAVFDHMIPRISRYYRREEVEALMVRAGLRDVRLEWVNDVSWSALGVKSE